MARFGSLAVGELFVFLSIVTKVIGAPLESGPTVTLSSGIVIGTNAKPTNQPSLTASANAYLGVPFAKSPPERFSPPQPASPWSSPLVAQAIKPACIQQFSGTGETRERTMEYFNNNSSPPPEESEDCLYLNVYTPPGVTATSNKAVMFWLFGGNLAFGAGGLDFYDGSSLAINEDVVVVTINYRTNIFGFSNSPEIPFGSQNSGFLDQRFALQWVQDNIKQFGGNPDRVMLFGESAGGESVKQLLANPPTPIPFSSAILQSQNAVLPGDGELNYKQVLTNFGCSEVNCLRQVPAADIKSYIETNSLSFPPVNDDRTSTRDVRLSITSSKFANVPILLGTDLNEERIFLAAAGLNDGNATIDNQFDSLNITSPVIRDSIIASYAAKGIEDLYLLADRLATDLVFTCTTARLANYLALFGRTVYRYLYTPEFPNLNIFPNAGAYHSSEIPQVFGTYPLSNQYGSATQQQIQLSTFMQKTWANFAKKPRSGVGWPKVGSFGPDLGVLGRNGDSGVLVRSKLEFDYACPIYAPIEDLLGLSF
ncbi:liver carboxylesterase 1 precursor [Stemphylium lycopersici]|nr:hypothetical protein TW65_03249 [Stemphylium lycopersici]RAR03396.1 liver carboxylesterase 1 precursor [Stemphylium lycopersici]